MINPLAHALSILAGLFLAASAATGSTVSGVISGVLLAFWHVLWWRMEVRRESTLELLNKAEALYDRVSKAVEDRKSDP